VSQSSILGRFPAFSSKWRIKLFPFSVFTSDSNFTSSTLLKTTYISIWYVGDFSKVKKFENYLNELQTLFIRNFYDISWSLWSSITWQQKINKIGIYKTQKSHFSTLGLGNFEARYSLFHKMPHSGVNISGKRKDAPVKFSPLIKPLGVDLENVMKSPIEWGIWVDEPRVNRKKSQKSDIAGAVG